MKEILTAINNIINQRGTIAKKQLLAGLKDNEEAIRALNLAFNPYLVTGIAKKKLNKIVDIEDSYNLETTFESLTNYLKSNNTGRDEDIYIVQTFILDSMVKYKLDQDEINILKDIITKDLTLGIAVKSINEVLGNIIPTFNCMLGSKLEDCKKELQGQEVAVTEKLDGNRCITTIKFNRIGINDFGEPEFEKEIHSFSRNGKEIQGLDAIHKTMQRLPGGVYDGELLAEDFNATQSTLRTKGTKSNLVYNIFDYVSNLDEFLDDSITETSNDYNFRREQLNNLYRMFGDPDRLLMIGDYVKIVPVLGKFIYDEEKVMAYHDMIKEKGGEGVMLNITSAGYIKDRTKKLVKVKAMKTCDLKCIGIQRGTGRLADTLGNIVCEYKGYEVKVGSGFDDDSRQYYINHPQEILNHIVEIQYFEETTNDNGTVSLRFPVFLKVRNDKDEESYN